MARQVGLQPILLLVLERGLAQVADHLVDFVLEERDLASGVDPDVPGEVAFGYGRGHLGHSPDLGREVGGQLVDVVGQVLPGAGRTGHVRLAAEHPVDADLSSHGRDLLREGGQRVGHVVDGVRQRRDLALGFEDHFAAKVAVGHGGNDPGNAAHLVGQVAGHQVHVVGQVFPGAGHALHPGLAAQLAFGADLTRHPGDLRSKGIELVDHHVDGVLQLEDLALDLDRDLPR